MKVTKYKVNQSTDIIGKILLKGDIIYISGVHQKWWYSVFNSERVFLFQIRGKDYKEFIETLTEIPDTPTKTITVSEEIYTFLTDLAKEVATQDHRCTRPPYFFQVQEDQEVAVPDNCGQEAWVMDGEVCLRTEKDIKEAVFEWKEWTLGNKKHEAEYQSLTSYDVEEILKENYRKVEIDIKPTYSNCFFTEKACQEHIRQNRHNLNNPVAYLHAAYRNREMEMMFRFLEEINNIKE